MADKRALRGRRAFLQDTVPLLIGRNPERVAPAHIVNGFLTAVYGEGPEAGSIRSLLRSTEPIQVPTLSSTIADSPTSMTLFRDSLNIVLNPDRRVFPAGGSPFPLHAAFISKNPSDDGFGRDVLEVVAKPLAAKEEILRELVAPTQTFEAISALGRVLGNGYSPQPQAISSKPGATKWLGPQTSINGRFAEALGDLVLSAAVLSTARLRSDRLVALTRGVACAAFLGSIRSAELTLARVDSWDELSPMFFYGGVPPGRAGHPEERLASQCFEAVVAAQKRSLEGLLLSRMKGKRVPRAAPTKQKLEILLKLAFPDLKRGLLEAAVGAVRWSSEIAGVAKSLGDALYPNGYLERGYRGLGRMVGLAGPDRGAGAPRFMFETPCLALLVSSTTPASDPITYPEWVDRLYDKFGILVGLGERIDPEPLLKKIGLTGNLSRAIEANHEALRKRLIAAGLATEYSDGETEVHAHPVALRKSDA